MIALTTVSTNNLLLPTLNDTAGWQQLFSHPHFGWAMVAVAAIAAFSWVFVRRLATVFSAQVNGIDVLFGRRVIDGVMFPIVLLVLTFFLRAAMAHGGYDTIGLRLVFPFIFALLSINVSVKVLAFAFHKSVWFASVRRLIVWVVWVLVAAWFSGILTLVMAELDEMKWVIGGHQVALGDLLSGALTAFGLVAVALWLSAAVDARLLSNASGAELSVRKAISNIVRVVFIFVGLMMALSAVGIDLTALSVLGGALGVGIGFGLQKLAANYVSGFVILAERSLRIGDLVRVDGFEGHITDIKARYTVIQAPGGEEAVVPNEMLLINRVENLSLANKRLWQSTSVTVGYDSDTTKVIALLEGAAAGQARVLLDPGPHATLMSFDADGLNFRLGFWIDDPENGRANVLSEVNMAILDALRANQIDIPYPQRVVHMR
jgi:small-conductance mechanosensitive channel